MNKLTEQQIDTGAKALRDKFASSGKHGNKDPSHLLRKWEGLDAASRNVWRDYACAVLNAALTETK